MSTVVESPQCFPKALKFGTFTFPAPEACHESCPGGHTIRGVLGGWVCPCECHQKPCNITPPKSGSDVHQYDGCRHTEHAIRPGVGRVGRWFPDTNRRDGEWEPCPEHIDGPLPENEAQQ